MSRLTRWIAVLGTLLLAAACTSEGGDGERRAPTLNGCDEVACTGTIDGARYQIRLPSTWNGTLLLYSHGYRPSQPFPPDYGPLRTDPQVAATEPVADALLDAGYALAGSAYARNGWAVPEGVEAGEKLRAFFVDKVGKPERTYVWGDSLGGLITQTLAEKHPGWVSGAAPMCGVLGGATLNLDLGLDIAYAVRTLLYPQFKVTGYASYAEAKAAFDEASRRVLAATRDQRTGVPKLLVISALADGPRQTARYDGSTLVSSLSAVVESILTGLAFSTVARWEVEQRVGGNPSGNQGVDYGRRVAAGERSLIETVASGSTARSLAALASGARIAPDKGARAAAARLGNPTGVLKDPTITVHTAADPLVIVQNEAVFAARVEQADGRTADLVQAFTVAPKEYRAPAPYGAGHCVFTTGERVGTIAVLDTWVRTGRAPSPKQIEAAYGDESGYDPAYEPGPWPAGGR